MRKYSYLLVLLLANVFLLSSSYAATHDKHKKTLHKSAKSVSTLAETQEKFDEVLDSVTPTGNSILEKKLAEKKEAEDNSLTILLFRPTYILPYYYSQSPNYAVYTGATPGQQKIMRNEFKGQLSLVIPVWSNMFSNPDLSMDFAYTQLNYWQVYASSQYFREINYEPELFVENHFHHNWLLRAGLDHQSNGRGGELERSWNRAVGTLQFSGEDWLVSLKAWSLIFQTQSSDLHNRDIAKFLGYENLRFSYKYNKAVFSIEGQNFESGLRRGFVQATVSYPMLKHVSAYAQVFSGYGQSLIEYNHRTNGVGIGIAFNDWV